MSGSNLGFGKSSDLIGKNSGPSPVTVGLFKKDGREAQENTIQDTEAFFNTLLAGVHDVAKGKADEQEW
jgi:hypothetical protein